MQAAIMESDTVSIEGCSESECSEESSSGSIWSSFPEELVHLVLQRLPLESVMRFRRVCKRWNDLFMSSAFSHSFCHKPGKLVPLYLDGTTVNIYDTTSRSWLQHELDTSLDRLSYPKGNDFELVASAGGLLCLMVKKLYEHDYFVYNPMTQECHRLPPISMFYDSEVTPSIFFFNWELSERKMLCGVDADLETGNYRFVILNPGDSNHEGMTLIYDSRSSSWRRGCEFPRSVKMLDEYTKPRDVRTSIGCKSQCVSLKGKLYWLVGSGANVVGDRDLVHIYDMKLDRWSYVKCRVPNERMTFLRCVEHEGEVLVVGKRGPRHSKKPFCYFEIVEAESESSSASMDVRQFHLRERRAMPMEAVDNILKSFQVEGKTEVKPSWCVGANDEIIFLLDAQSFDHDSNHRLDRRKFLFSSPMVQYSGHGVDPWTWLTNWKILKDGSSSLKPYASYRIWAFQPSLVSP